MSHSPTPTVPRWLQGSRQAVLGLALCLGAGGAMAQAAGNEWLTPSGTLQATRFSRLAEINTRNVSTLVQEFAAPTGVKASHQGQPLVVGNTVYMVTPYPNRLIALDAVTRTTRWTFNPNPDEYAQGVACCDVVNRGPAYGNGKIVFTTLDATVVAVDATTGTLAWRTRLGNPRTGETMTGAPLVVGNKVIVGNSGGEMGIRGWVQALNLDTGAVAWKAFNTGPDADVKIGPNFVAHYAKDRGTDLGATSWPGTLWRQGGATAWAWFSYDPGLNLVYYGTANPGVWNPDLRPGDNKWGATIFARNADTGEAAWAYQVTPHDGWDFDAVSENIVADLPVPGGGTRKVIVHFDKNGFAYTIDRATGQVLVAKPFAHVTWADRIDLATGAPVVNPGFDPHEGVITSNICPSPLGGKEFAPASFSPRTRLFYVPAINLCQNLEPLRANFIAATPFVGADVEIALGPGTNLGELLAWDAVRGTKVWSILEPLPLYGGTLATAGNVVFYGTLDRWFKAVDATSGAVLFQTQLPCPVIGNPIAFTGPDGRQRVAVYSGVGWLAGGFAGGTCPLIDNAQSATALARGMSRLAEVQRATQGAADRPAAELAPTSGQLHVFRLP